MRRSPLDGQRGDRYTACFRTHIFHHTEGPYRPMLRFYACEEDLSHESPDAPLPPAVASGAEPYWIVAAIAGG